MIVIKRTGEQVKYDGTKIIAAICNAMIDVKALDVDLAKKVEDRISENLKELKNNKVSIEDIQDLVEENLIQLGAVKVAKAYILYRASRAKERKSEKSEKEGLLTKKFLSKYKHIQPPMTTLGESVYFRTYSRYLPDKKRREYWWETIQRAIEYNASLIKTTREEAEELYDNIFNLRQFLSGRTFWTGGTPVALKYSMSNYNCFRKDEEFITKDGIKKFSDFSDGEATKVLDKNGAWADATVRNFGEDRLVELHVKKYGSKYSEIIHTTKDHVWFKRKTKNQKSYVEAKTSNLKSGDVLRLKRRYEHQTVQMCNIGVMHGMVYGDGTFDKFKNHTKISLIGKKQELLDLFTTGSVSTEGDRDSTLIYGLPNHWKELPDKANVEYMNGFLYGLCLVDAPAYGSIKLVQSNREALETIRSMFSAIGVITSKVGEIERTNKNFGDYKNSYGISIYRDTLPANWGRFNETKAVEVKWVVDKVVETDIVEDVFCVVEPKTETFTLANGILTHNCSFQIINDFEAFKDIFYLLMIGSGAGIRVLKKDVAELPAIRTGVEVIDLNYSPVAKRDRLESTSLIFRNKEICEIVVGDSKEGWVQSLDFFFSIISSFEYANIKTVLINYNNVREKGERLKTFGGTASGPKALMTIFEKIVGVIERNNHQERYKLKPIDALDIANIIGEGVVVGGVRRTSEIILTDSDDEEVIKAKSALYIQTDGVWKIDESIAHRQMSNNTIFYKEKPTREFWKWHLGQMRYSGEPGIVNEQAASLRRPNFEGVNPCAEILLNNRGLCNLTTLNVMAFVVDGTLDEQRLLKAQRLSARASYRMTNVELELPKWDKVQKEERLTGCSLTGWQDMVNAAGLSKEKEAVLLRELRAVAHEEINALAKLIGANPSLLTTTLKPEGTLSQLPTVSSGIHYSHSPFYIRRVRINANDPILKVLEEDGYRIFPENGQTLENCTTKVIEFPVKAPKGTTKYDITALEQLENYKMFMENYVDHNASITVHVREHEWDIVEEWIWNNWDLVVAISFLPLDDSFYSLLPYEAIDEEEFILRSKEVEGSKLTPERIAKYEVIDETFELDDSCDTGACPVR